MSKIDVIMPTYNQCDYLHRAIDHILAQTFQDFCFIIVNDGSKDKTKDVLIEYEKIDKIKIINNEKNKGLPASLNIGHSAGNSPYCMWISTDNISFPNQLEKLYEKIINEDLDFVQSPWIAEIEKTGQIFYQDVRRVKSNWGMGTIGGSFLYKRIVWETYKYDEELQYVEDLKFYLQALLHPFKFGHVEENLMKYYVQPNSLSGREDMSKHQSLMDKIYKDVIEPNKDKILSK